MGTTGTEFGKVLNQCLHIKILRDLKRVYPCSEHVNGTSLALPCALHGVSDLRGHSCLGIWVKRAYIVFAFREQGI